MIGRCCVVRECRREFRSLFGSRAKCRSTKRGSSLSGTSAAAVCRGRPAARPTIHSKDRGIYLYTKTPRSRGQCNADFLRSLRGPRTVQRGRLVSRGRVRGGRALRAIVSYVIDRIFDSAKGTHERRVPSAESRRLFLPTFFLVVEQEPSVLRFLSFKCCIHQVKCRLMCIFLYIHHRVYNVQIIDRLESPGSEPCNPRSSRGGCGSDVVSDVIA